MEAKGRSVLITGAVAHGQRPRPEGRLPDLGHRLQGRLSSSARSTSASRSGASSIPALKRMKPSADGVAAPARAALGVGVQAAEARGLRHQLAGAQEGVGAGVRADVEADDRADAGPAHVADVVAGAQRRRRARGRWPPGARGAGPAWPASGARATPRTAPGSSPWRSATRAAPPRARASATATVPMIRSLWPPRYLERAHHRVVGAELERALAQRARERVVDGDDRARGVGLGAERAQVEDVEPRVGRRLEPHERRARQRLAHGVVGRGHEPHLDAVGLEHVAGDGADPRVGVRRRHEHVAGVQPRDDHGADRRHPGGEDHALRRPRARPAHPPGAPTSGCRSGRS